MPSATKLKPREARGRPGSDTHGTSAQPRGSLRDELLDLVTASVRDGVPLGDAAAEAADHVKRAGRSVEFMNEMGATAIAMLWRNLQHSLRSSASSGPQGAPRINPSTVKHSVFDAMISVDGHYRFQGDLTKPDALWLARDYGRQIADLQTQADGWKAIAAKLRGEEKIRDKFTEAQFTAMFRREQ